MNNLWKIHAPLMAEEGGEGGGAAPTEQTKTEPTQTQAAEPAKTEPTQTAEPAKTEPTQSAEPAKTEPTQAAEPAKTEPTKPVNLLDDEEEKTEPAKTEPEKTEAEPTEEERKAFVDEVKKIDIGEGVVWDDPALEAIAPSLMELAGRDAKKTEKIVKAYTAYQQGVFKAMQEKSDKLNNDNIAECYRRFGGKDGTTKVCALAKKGGEYVFKGKWKEMRAVREFANNPDIIECLAAIGRTVTDDPGVIRKETASAPAKRDWRESMYGSHS